MRSCAMTRTKLIDIIRILTVGDMKIKLKKRVRLFFLLFVDVGLSPLFVAATPSIFRHVVFAPPGIHLRVSFFFFLPVLPVFCRARCWVFVSAGILANEITRN